MVSLPSDEHTEVSTEVGASIERCFEVATDLDSYPDWAEGIIGVEVHDYDEDKRPVRAAFDAQAMGRRTSYTLTYDYERAPFELSWRLVEGDLTRRLEGTYMFAPSGERGDQALTSVTYKLSIDLAVPLPGFVRRRAETKIVEAALQRFKGRVESVG